MKLKLSAVAAALAVCCGTASAGQIFIGGGPLTPAGKFSNRAGACTVDFNSGNASNSCNVTYTPPSGNNFRTGSLAGQYAAPAGDSSGYVTVGPTDGSPLTIILATPANYFGFFAGSLDTYNTVTFFNGAVQVDQFTGTQINAVAFPGDPTNGDQADAQYIDYFPTASYNRIVYSSSQNAFETDNHAFGNIQLVPEPGSVALLGLGALGLLASRRRKAGKA